MILNFYNTRIDRVRICSYRG